MKHSILFFMAVVVLAAISCTKDPDEQKVSEKELVTMSFDATLATPTKTELGESNGAGGYKVLWSKDDAIKVYPHDGETQSSGIAFTTDIASASASATFSGEIEAAEDYYAFYPGSVTAKWYPSNKDFGVTLSDNQTSNGIANGFMVAKADSEKNLQFDHVCGYVKFVIPDEYDGKISKVYFEGKNEESLAGYLWIFPDDMTKNKINSSPKTKLTLNPASGDAFASGTYYFTIFPTALEDGFTLTFIDTEDRTATKSTDNPATISAGHILNLGSMTGLSFETSDPTISDGTYAVLAKNGDEYYYLTNEDTGNSTKRLAAENSGYSVLPGNMGKINPAYVWEFTYESGKYSMIDTDELMLSHTSENTAFVSADKGVSVKVDDNGDGTYSVHYTASDAERYLSMTDSGAYYVFYKSGVSSAIYELYLVPAVADTEPKITSVTTNDPTGLTATGGNLNGSLDGYNLEGAEIVVGFEINGNSYAATLDGNLFSYSINGLTTNQSYTYRAWASLDGGETKVYGDNATITPEASVETNSITMVLTNQGYDDKQIVTSLTVTPITVSFAKGTHKNSVPTYYDNGTALRYYEGNTITFTGGVIRRIVVTAPSANYSKLSANQGVISIDGVTSTWEGKSTEVVLSGTASGRITEIVVTYEIQ